MRFADTLVEGEVAPESRFASVAVLVEREFAPATRFGAAATLVEREFMPVTRLGIAGVFVEYEYLPVSGAPSRVFQTLDGTTRDHFRLGAGPNAVQLVRANADRMLVRDDDDADFVRLAGADPVDQNDFVTLRARRGWYALGVVRVTATDNGLGGATYTAALVTGDGLALVGPCIDHGGWIEVPVETSPSSLPALARVDDISAHYDPTAVVHPFTAIYGNVGANSHLGIAVDNINVPPAVPVVVDYHIVVTQVP